jgi:hypothetical protein
LTGRQRPTGPGQKRSTAQRVAEQVIVSACVLLPEDVRDERYREWAAELPAILHDPDIRSPITRTTRALRFAVSTHRSVPWTRGNVRKRAVDVFFVLLLVATGAYSWQDTCAVAGALIALPAAYRFGRSVF